MLIVTAILITLLIITATVIMNDLTWLIILLPIWLCIGAMIWCEKRYYNDKLKELKSGSRYWLLDTWSGKKAYLTVISKDEMNKTVQYVISENLSIDSLRNRRKEVGYKEFFDRCLFRNNHNYYEYVDNIYDMFD